jgi:pimeloyl-ACP methyl ester carboxylesterase
MQEGGIATLDRGDGVRLAYQRRAGAQPTFVWLSGFMSDMGGTKAEALWAWAEARGQAFLRFDYSGHGRSGGAFEAGGIGRWAGDAKILIERASEGPLVLVGSSMGAWAAILVAAALPHRIAGMLLLAPAPDFTDDLLWPRLPEEARVAIETTGRWQAPAPAGETGAVYTKALIEDGRRHRVLTAPIAFAGPVRILQGRADADVPWRRSLALVEQFASADVVFTLIKDGDHRLSRPQDLARLQRCADALADMLG